MTQEQFNQNMEKYLAELGTKEPSDWSLEARDWCESMGLIEGDENGDKKYKKFVTKEEVAAIIYKLQQKKLIK